MTAYVTSDKVNTNLIADESRGRVDLGKQFVAVKESTADENVCLDYNQPYVQFGQPFVTPEGFIALILSKDLRIDFNTNHAICVTTPLMKAAIDNVGQNIGLIHPFGRVYQDSYQNCVHFESGIRLAKMCSRGVTFTSLYRSLIYLVDTSGCKTTTERFRKLNYDFTSDIFHANSLSGDIARQRSFAELCRHSFELSEDGSDKNWWIGGVKIRHNLVTGNAVISKSHNKILIHIHPTKNFVKINSENLRIVANSNAETFFQVIRPHPRDEQRVAASLQRFQVKNGSQKAGFDVNDELILM